MVNISNPFQPLGSIQFPPVILAPFLSRTPVAPQMPVQTDQFCHPFVQPGFQIERPSLETRLLAGGGSSIFSGNGKNGSSNGIGGPNGAPPPSGGNGDDNLPGGCVPLNVWRRIRQLAKANDLAGLQKLFEKMGSTDLWAIYSRLYDDIQLNLSFTRDLLDDHEKFAIGPKILDVGAGTGLNTINFLKCGFEVVAVEPNEDMRACLKQRIAHDPRATVLGTFFEDAPLGDAEFATVNIRNVIYLVNDPKAFLAKAFKHTSAGGRVLVSGPMRNAATTLAEQNRMAQQMLKEANDPELIWKDRVVGALSKKLLTNIHAYDVDEISQLLNDTGFTRVLFSSNQHFLGAFFFVAAEKPL